VKSFSHDNYDVPSFVYNEFLDNLKLNISRDIDLSSVLLLMIKSVMQYGEEGLNEKLMKFSEEVYDRANKPPFYYDRLARFYLIKGDYDTFFEVAMKGYKRYNHAAIKYLVNQVKPLLKFSQRVEAAITFGGGFEGFSFFKYLGLYLLIFAIPLFLNLINVVVGVLPIVFSDNTLNYIIRENQFWGYPLFLGFFLAFLSFVFAILNGLVDRIGERNLKKGRKYRKVLVITAFLLTMLFLCINFIPSLLITNDSVAYISTEEIGGNTFKAQYDEIRRVNLKIIDPTDKNPDCTVITDDNNQCMYEYELEVEQTDNKVQTFFSGKICKYSGCIDEFIFNDLEATETFLEKLANNDVEINTDFDDLESDKGQDYDIPEVYKEAFELFSAESAD
jgi:hypothetical protein